MILLQKSLHSCGLFQILFLCQILKKLNAQVLIFLYTSCTNVYKSLQKFISFIYQSLYIIYYCFISVAIKLLNAELVEIDASNYKTDWMISYLRGFAEKNKIPFAALMKVLRSVLSGLKVNMTHKFPSIVTKNI